MSAYFIDGAVEAQGQKSFTQGHTASMWCWQHRNPRLSESTALSCGGSHHIQTKIPGPHSGQLRCHVMWLCWPLGPIQCPCPPTLVPAMLASLIPGPAEFFPVPEPWNVMHLLLTVLFPEAPGTAGLQPSLPQRSGHVLPCGFPGRPWR